MYLTLGKRIFTTILCGYIALSNCIALCNWISLLGFIEFLIALFGGERNGAVISARQFYRIILVYLEQSSLCKTYADMEKSASVRLGVSRCWHDLASITQSLLASLLIFEFFGMCLHHKCHLCSGYQVDRSYLDFPNL